MINIKPGPWRIGPIQPLKVGEGDDAIPGAEITILAGEGDERWGVCTIRQISPGESAVHLAHANLIVAGPDLYQVALVEEILQSEGHTEASRRKLQRLGIDVPDHAYLPTWRKRFRRSVLAKAEGREAQS